MGPNKCSRCGKWEKLLFTSYYCDCADYKPEVTLTGGSGHSTPNYTTTSDSDDLCAYTMAVQALKKQRAYEVVSRIFKLNNEQKKIYYSSTGATRYIQAMNNIPENIPAQFEDILKSYLKKKR